MRGSGGQWWGLRGHLPLSHPISLPSTAFSLALASAGGWFVRQTVAPSHLFSSDAMTAKPHCLSGGLCLTAHRLLLPTARQSQSWAADVDNPWTAEMTPFSSALPFPSYHIASTNLYIAMLGDAVMR